jgi:hypothetical protein
MSDIDSDTDSISDSSNAHSYDDDGDESSISSAVRVLCDRLRANDPRMSTFIPFDEDDGIEYSECERINVFQTLKENTSVKHIRLWSHGYTKRSARAAAKCLESSQSLQTIDLRYNGSSQELPMVISILLLALSRNTLVTKLCVNTDVVRFASVALQELLTSTQTLKTMSVICYHFRDEGLDEADIAAITSGFANNTTLRDLEFRGWREANLAPVLTALQEHPALQKIRFSASPDVFSLPSLSGLEVLLRSQDSKVKELVIEHIDTSNVGLYPVIRELGRNTKVTKLAIINSALSRENVQELKSMLRRNTALESLESDVDFYRERGSGRDCACAIPQYINQGS